MAIAQSMRQEAAEKDLIARLGNQGIPACIIKGNAIARILYEDPNCRSSADIDVLVTNRDVVKADLILRHSRFIPNSQVPLSYLIYHHHHTTYYDSKTKNHIELHWNFGVPHYFRLSSEEIWEGITTDSDGRLTASPALLLVILLIHHHSHTFRELRILVDLLWLFHKYDLQMDWAEVACRLKRLGLTKTMLICISQLEALWPAQISTIRSATELKKALAGMGCGVSGYLISYFRMDLSRTSALNAFTEQFYARLALDDLSTIILSFTRTIAPPPAVIRDMYHSNSNLMLMINYVRFICRRLKVWLGGW